MSVLSEVYKPSLALMTDLYEFTMAYSYWKTGMRDREAAFALTFRKPPFGGGYVIVCGLAYVVDYLVHFKFTESDLSYLESLQGENSHPLFEPAFLAYLRDLRLSCDVDAIPEGTAVFAHEPLVRVCGPIIECQLLESMLLNLVNFQSLIATKAARICQAAGDAPVLEFGLRRAQGLDGALGVARAAYVGGCAATSNVLAGRICDIPVKGTHAHSWVMAFDDELAAFQAFADAQPGNCILLVDTYNTLDGVRHAVQVALRMRQQGRALLGIRLDSGDFAYLSIESRRILDEAGLEDVKIIASGDLDEHLIENLRLQGARIDIFAVGTRLVTAHDDPALGGVYKLTALRKPGSPWEDKVKLSEQIVKTSIPGIQQVRRFDRNGEFVADMIYEERLGAATDRPIIHPEDPTRRKEIPPGLTHSDLLVPILRKGQVVYDVPALATVRARCHDQLGCLHPGIKRLANPHEYPAGLHPALYEKRTRLILKARGETA